MKYDFTTRMIQNRLISLEKMYSYTKKNPHGSFCTIKDILKEKDELKKALVLIRKNEE